jgi:transposase-like protein
LTFPKEHRAKLNSTNSIESMKGEVKCRDEMGGIFTHLDAIIRPVIMPAMPS